MSYRKSSSFFTATLGIFTALTVLLQVISYFVKIGTFSLTLTLIPIILAAVMYGPIYSTFLGFSFGALTVIGCITGIDAGGGILFGASPWRNIVLCMGKALLCGFLTGVIAQAIKKKSVFLAVIVSAVAAPVINTGSFIIIMFLLYKSVLYEWAGGTDIVTYILVGLVGVNFLIELAINTFLSPIVYRIVRSLKRYI